MNTKTLLIYTIFLFSSWKSFAQDQFYFIARIIDLQTLESVPNANIVNLKNKKGTSSNQLGYFMIQVTDKDYLRISYIGYNNLYIQIDKNIKDTLNLYLQEKIFELENVDVYPWSKEEFKYEFVYHKFKSDSIDGLKASIKVPVAELRALGPNGIPAFKNFKTKKEKQEIKLIELKKWLKKDQSYRVIIKKITNYEDAELEAFIRFCNFSRRYISYAREYYLTFAISLKYKEFEKLKSEQKLQNNN